MDIIVKKVTKKIAEKEIFKMVEFSLKTGQALALRGVNGSGKTTLIRILLGLDQSYSGEVRIQSSKEYRIGYISQDIVLFQELSVIDNLLIFATKDRPRKKKKNSILQFAERFAFRDLLSKKVKHLSGGQKRLIHIVACLINEPDLIFLDEAIVGIDEDKVKLIEAYLLEIREKRIMILTSHQDDFLKKVGNRSAIFREGELHFEDELS